MMLVALIMRPWVIQMRTVSGTQAFILADGVLVLSTGSDMVRHAAVAIDKTHAYLHAMGAKVAPDKSYNFASLKVARDWFRDTWWQGISSKIEVVEDLRYLGARLNTKGNCAGKTLEKRWAKAYQQLKKLVNASHGGNDG